jgi:hypothetical protein
VATISNLVQPWGMRNGHHRNQGPHCSFQF